MKTIRTRKTTTQWHFKEKQCVRCSAVFMPHGTNTKYCDLCGPLTIKESRTRKRNVQIDNLGPQQCWYCGETYFLTHLVPRIACNKCNGLPKANGQAGTYLVQGMLVAEFAFFTIMQQRGSALKYIGRDGAWFEIEGSPFRPDFKVPLKDIYYEVVGSRQRYHQAKHKYKQFRERYPHLTLIVVRPDGTDIELN